ncbi:MAG: hypothetical protein AAFX96_05100 [Pseudomonadota bacterium]
MINIFRKLFSPIVLAGILLAPSAVLAQQETDAPTSETDPVLVFNRVCYAQVPVIENIRDMSTRFAWERIGGDDLKQFTTLESPDVLEGWDVRIAKKLYRLGIVQSKPSEVMQKTFPEFADGQATSCSLVLDGSDEADLVLERMNSLARKEPNSADVPDGDLLTTTWAGGNEDFKVFLFFKSDQNGKANLLNVTILARKGV